LNATKLYRSSICIFIEVSAKNHLKIRFLGPCFGFLSFLRNKNTYLIRSFSENSNFLWEMFFYVISMCAKNNEKNQPLCNFFGHVVGKIFAILPVSIKKIKLKLRLSWNTTKIYRSSICSFIEVSAKKNLKIRFLGWCFGVLSFRRVKNSYLICHLLKNLNFFGGDVFLS